MIFLFLICVGIGFFVSGPLSYLVARRAGGRLPLTHRSKYVLEAPLKAAIAALALSAFLGIITAIALTTPYDPANPTPQVIGVVLINFALIAFVLGAVLLQLGPPAGQDAVRSSRQGDETNAGQTDRVLELMRVHPAFVAAVQQRQSAPPPQSPATN